jgi:alpha-tubulin suppressor-like RCC1 family protein
VHNEDLLFIYTRYNTNIAVERKGKVFMWGEDSNNLRLRKPKLFYVSNKSIRQVSLGKRHGIIVTEEEKGGIYGWGDGTYGELGVTDDLPIE